MSRLFIYVAAALVAICVTTPVEAFHGRVVSRQRVVVRQQVVKQQVVQQKVVQQVVAQPVYAAQVVAVPVYAAPLVQQQVTGCATLFVK